MQAASIGKLRAGLILPALDPIRHKFTRINKTASKPAHQCTTSRDCFWASPSLLHSDSASLATTRSRLGKRAYLEKWIGQS